MRLEISFNYNRYHIKLFIYHRNFLRRFSLFNLPLSRTSSASCKQLLEASQHPPKASLIGFNINFVLLFRWRALNDAKGC